jgi:transaldolase
MKNLNGLKVKLFADGANLIEMIELSKLPYIKGLTTNPTLMRAAGVQNYKEFASQVLSAIPDLPVSFEVFSDDFTEMFDQANEISSWGKNVVVKIPISNTKSESSLQLIHALSLFGIKINVTAVFTINQVDAICRSLNHDIPANISIFAGRIADTGEDPMPIMQTAVHMLKKFPNIELIWASPRELLNVFQADSVGCHIITATGDILKKLSLIGKDLDEYSLDTVKMFYKDAFTAGYKI